MLVALHCENAGRFCLEYGFLDIAGIGRLS